ncbi:MAG: glutathione peroxidase [Chitinophagaceae bacterium]
MTIRQQITKAVYPLILGLTKLMGKNTKVLVNKGDVPPAKSFYDLSVQLNNGQSLPMETYKGKKVLLVNTASDCGYTPQYKDLQKLYEAYSDKLVIIGFPANDFREQEKGSDEQIAQFCEVNFGVTFPLAKKSTVIRTNDQHPVFNWLTHKDLNGWNDIEPTWNFSKYLVSEEGVLMYYFDPSISPTSEEIIKAVDK